VLRFPKAGQGEEVVEDSVVTDVVAAAVVLVIAVKEEALDSTTEMVEASEVVVVSDQAVATDMARHRDLVNVEIMGVQAAGVVDIVPAALDDLSNVQEALKAEGDSKNFT
jgi:hypothetical protein